MALETAAPTGEPFFSGGSRRAGHLYRRPPSISVVEVQLEFDTPAARQMAQILGTPVAAVSMLQHKMSYLNNQY